MIFILSQKILLILLTDFFSQALVGKTNMIDIFIVPNPLIS